MKTAVVRRAFACNNKQLPRTNFFPVHHTPEREADGNKSKSASLSAAD